MHCQCLLRQFDIEDTAKSCNFSTKNVFVSVRKQSGALTLLLNYEQMTAHNAKQMEHGVTCE